MDLMEFCVGFREFGGLSHCAKGYQSAFPDYEGIAVG